MRRLILVFIFSISIFESVAQTDDISLNKRLSEYLELNENMDFEKIMDYLYPKLFEIAPRELLVKTMKEAFNNEDVKISFDSMKILTVSPEYKLAGSIYRQIDYSLSMSMYFTDTTDLNDPDYVELMKANFETQFSTTKISFEKEKNVFIIHSFEKMMAIKENITGNWMFVGIKKEQEAIMKILFPKEVINKFKLMN